MATQVSLEIHVKQKGRWEIHARHPSSAKNAAIEEAKNLDQISSIDEVRVIRETYDSESGDTWEKTIYRTPGKSGQEYMEQQSSSSSGGGGGGGSSDWSSASSDDDDDEDDEDEFGDYDSDWGVDKKSKKRKGKNGKGGSSTFVGLIVKILLILLVSILLAGMAAGGTVVVLRGANFGSVVETNIIFIVFILIFLISAVSLAMNFLRGTNVNVPTMKRKARPKRKKEESASLPTSSAPEQGAPKAPASKQPPTPTSEDMLDKSGPEDDDDDDEDDDLDLDGEEDDDEETEEEEKEEKKPSSHADKQRIELMTFFSESMENTEADAKTMDSFNKFGINLFLAGAMENLGQARNLDPSTSAEILSGIVEIIGFKKADADKFANKYEEYLLADSRYMQMFQAGRNGMSNYLNKNPEGLSGLGKALKDWDTPTEKEETTGPVTVLFTDIAGSTAMTQNLGDEGAQKVVRAHNRIVRNALTKYGGKEIKHTGDGIMASFSTTSNSVEGSIQIQKDTKTYTAENPDFPLHIKIGINAGEPISEDNDLFGSTVQMSARIVDKAQAGQIFVSEIVRGICVGKPLKFNNAGQFEMKGFDEPPTLYEVVWE